MRARFSIQVAVCTLIALGIPGCCCPAVTLPKPGVSHLVGTWTAEYDKDYFGRRCWYTVTGVETLTLKADGTFRQVYDDGTGYVYTSPWNEWRLEDRGAGAVLHLQGGRFYPLGIELAEALADGSFSYHSDDDGRGQPLDLDGTEIILHVRRRSGQTSLDYPPVCDLDAPVIVTFYAVSEPAAALTALL
jgi:hypothetical protein